MSVFLSRPSINMEDIYTQGKIPSILLSSKSRKHLLFPSMINSNERNTHQFVYNQ